ncbi:hypothetical protein MRS44_008415 [Fusarium solani]|uniref:uncharacterized protein n=1 Tax=Fusarium solani TaxID=169388 RepID=UPI0032C48C09|nr:hypothetical protein MRS44_008415 [Fusarium solani]
MTKRGLWRDLGAPLYILAISVIENPKRITFPVRQSIATEFPETAAVPLRHSAGSQSKSIPAVVTQVSSRKPSPETIEDCDGMAGFEEDIRSPVKEKTPAPMTKPLLSDIKKANATSVESYENTTDKTLELWPSSTYSHFPVFTFQIRTVLSSEANTTIIESCENTTERTMEL